MPTYNTSSILYQFYNNETLDARKFDDIPDMVLACMIKHSMQNNAFFVKSASYLQPLVPRIMSFSDKKTKVMFDGLTLGDVIFRGSETFGICYFGKEPINPDNSASNDRYLNQGEFGVARLLFQLNVKAESLKSRNETDAYYEASKLYNALYTALMEYISSNKEVKDREALDAAWTQAVNGAKPELEKHRGWSNFIVNLLFVIPTLGFFMVYAGYKSHGKNFLFPFVDTDSASYTKKLEQIDKYDCPI